MTRKDFDTSINCKELNLNLINVIQSGDLRNPLQFNQLSVDTDSNIVCVTILSSVCMLC